MKQFEMQMLTVANINRFLFYPSCENDTNHIKQRDTHYQKRSHDFSTGNNTKNTKHKSSKQTAAFSEKYLCRMPIPQQKSKTCASKYNRQGGNFWLKPLFLARQKENHECPNRHNTTHQPIKTIKKFCSKHQAKQPKKHQCTRCDARKHKRSTKWICNFVWSNTDKGNHTGSKKRKENLLSCFQIFCIIPQTTEHQYATRDTNQDKGTQWHTVPNISEKKR